VVNRRDVGSWLQGPHRPESAPGPHVPGSPAAGDSAFPGQRLGRPETGPRSVARPGRRFLGLIIDWLLCLVIARGAFGVAALHPNGSLLPVGVLMIENVLLIGTAGATLGQRLVGLRVERVDGNRLRLLGTVVRAVLLGLGLPALTLLWEPDRRGLHDVLSGSVVVIR
jgi:uncharacterized RDD family membrane protein YckC